MAENKTKAGDASVEAYIEARASEEQRTDCEQLMAMLERVTRQKPKMWGPSIVGYGRYRYVYDSGRTGEMPLVGFAIRGRDLVVYLDCEEQEQQLLLSRLGRHKMGKSCLYLRRLSDIDKGVLEQLVVGSVDRVNRRYPSSSGA
jgi:hypothetical protein